MSIQGEDKNSLPEKWHVGKEIPIAMLFAICCQTVGAVWWAASFSATVSAKLDNLSFQVAALTEGEYTQQDAEKDKALFAEKVRNMQHEIDQIKDDMRWRQNRK